MGFRNGQKSSPKRGVEIELSETNRNPITIDPDNEIASDADIDCPAYTQGKNREQEFGPLEVFARYFFPLAFVGMIVGYWAYFLHRDYKV